MKKFVFSTFMFLLILCMGSCSKSGNSDLYMIANDNTPIVACMSPDVLITNAGGEVTDNGIVLTPAIKKLFNLKNDKAEIKGADLSCVFVATDGDELACSFGIKDKNAFANWLTETSKSEKTGSEGGWDIYNFDGDGLLLNDNLAVIIDEKPDKAYAKLQELADAAGAAPLAGWKQELLAKNNAGGALVSFDFVMEKSQGALNSSIFTSQYNADDIKNAWMAFNLEVKGPKATLACKLVNNNGAIIKAKTEAKDADVKMMRYANNGDIMGLLVNLGYDIDYKAMLDEMAKQVGGYRNLGLSQEQANMIAEVLSNIDGTVMLAAAPINLARIDKIDGWQVALAAQMKEGAAQKYFDQLKGLASMYSGILKQLGTFIQSENEMSLVIPGNASIYAKVDGNNLVFATTPITDDAKTMLDMSYFNGKPFCFEAILPADNEIAKTINLPFVPTFVINGNNNGCETILAIDGDKNLLESIFEYASSMN